MSYSFNVRGETKALAKQAVADKFAEIAAQQPVHLRDKDAVLSNANAAIDLLAEDDSMAISVSVNGHVSWGTSEEGSDAPLNTVAISATAFHAKRP